MRPIDRLWNSRRLILLTGDGVIFCAVLALTFTLRDHGGFSPGLLLPFLPVFWAVIITAYAAGLYEFRVIRDFVALAGGLFGSALASIGFGTAYFYFLSPYLHFSPRLTLVFLVGGTYAGMLTWRRAVLSGAQVNLLDLKVLVLADDSAVAGLRGSFGRRSGDDVKFVGNATLVPGVNLVVVDRCWTDSHADNARRVMTAAIGRQIPIISVSEFHESMCGRVSPRDASDLGWALDNVLPRFGGLYFTAKRVLDVLTAAVLLVLLAPVILVVGLAVHLVDGGSALYAQQRVGYLGRPFLLWKFRSMRQGADQQGPFIQTAEEGDARVTRLGSLLRRFRIDELPQLWNVLKGDMSLVGPRPEWIREVEILESALPTYSLRYLVPPGITGWAQVYFRATNSPEAGIEKHHYDLYYLKHFSLALDLSILLKTVKRVMTRERRTFTQTAPRSAELEPEGERPMDVASLLPRS